MANNGTATKSLDDEAVKRSVQDHPDAGRYPLATMADQPLLFFAAGYAEDITPWGTNTKVRDRELREFIPKEPIFASSLGIVTARNAAFSWTIEGPGEEADRWQNILQTANFGRGWAHLMALVSVDLYTTDTGAFIEIIRAGDSPDAEVISIAHLDSLRCYPTGVPETPVVYVDRHGSYHLLKWYQVVHLLEMPATWEQVDIQWCALTRMLRAASILKDISTYLSEKIGGRNERAITLIAGVTAEQVSEAISVSRAQHDTAGLYRFSQPILVNAKDPNAKVGFETLELASIPDGFDLDLTNKQYIAQIAMAFGSDYQEFAPLPGGGLGTSNQSEILHKKNRGKGPGYFMKLLEHALNFQVLSRNIQFRFDEQDDDADRAKAEISTTRANERATRIASRELSVGVARMRALADGDLTQEEYDALVAEEAAQQAEQPTPQTPGIDEISGSDDQTGNGSGPSITTTPDNVDEVVDDSTKTLTERVNDAVDLSFGITKARDDRAGPDSRERVEDAVAELLDDVFADLYDDLADKLGLPSERVKAKLNEVQRVETRDVLRAWERRTSDDSWRAWVKDYYASNGDLMRRLDGLNIGEAASEMYRSAHQNDLLMVGMRAIKSWEGAPPIGTIEKRIIRDENGDIVGVSETHIDQ